jgi:hypothetical protein
MSCKKTEEFMRENPGSGLPQQLQAHAQTCPDCLKLWQRQQALAEMLRAVPRAELPPYLAKAPVLREPETRGSIWPALVPALALGLALAMMLMKLTAPPVADPIQPGPVEMAAGPGHPAPEGTGTDSGPSDIYPVWPPDGQAIESEDMTIMVSIYPHRKGEVTILLNGTDVTASSTVGRQHISFSPAGLQPGEHQVQVLLQQPDGSRSTASWSFYLLEELS